MTTLAVFLILAAVATLLLHRDLREADRRRRTVTVTLTIDTSKVEAAFAQMAAAMADMRPAFERVGRAMREAGSK